MIATNSSPDLAQKTVKGVFWSYSTFLGGKLLTFLSTVILARLLLPEQFGLVGYCLVTIQYLDILNSAGINNSLVARREKIEEAANAAFVANIILGIIFFGLTWVIAPAAAVFFKTDELIPVLRLMGLNLPLSGLGMVPDTLLQRHLRFRTRMLPMISQNLIKGVVSIILAWMGMGVWSLVWGQLAGSTINTILAWMLAAWKPTWRFDAEATFAIATYGIHIMLLEIAGAFRNNVDYLLVGRILGAAALGYYTMSYRIPELLIRSVNIVVGRVSLPVMSIVQKDDKQLYAFYFSYLRSISMIIFPVAGGLALTAPVFIPLFFSEKWNAAIIPTMLISLALGIAAMGFVPGVLYKAISRPEVLTRLNFIKVPLAVAVLWYSTRWGISGVAAGQIAIGIFSMALDTLAASYIMRYPVKSSLDAIAPSFYAAVAMAGVLLAVRRMVPVSGILGFSLLVLTGIVVYPVVLWRLDHQSVLAGIQLLRGAFMKAERSNTSNEPPVSINEIRVSAVITAYNSQGYIAEAISSVLDQTFPVHEIVVVDDGSTDHTGEIVKRFSDRGVRYIYQANQGPGAARNHGIRETTGEIIAFLDADDVWLQDKVKIQLEYLAAHPKIGVVSSFSWWWNVKKDIRLLAGEASTGMAALRRDLMIYNKMSGTSRLMVRRSVLNEVGLFDPTIRWGQDWDLWIRVITRYDAAILPTPLILYRWHEKNLSNTGRWDRLSSYWNISRKAIRAYRPAWQRPFLLLRSWSLFTLRRAKLALEEDESRWRGAIFAGASLLVYPWDMSRSKISTVLRAVLGEKIYLHGKQFFRARQQAGGGA